MTQFLPTQIFSIFVPTYDSRATHLGLRASPFGFQTDILRVDEDRTGCEKVARGFRWCFGVEVESRVPPCCAARDGPARSHLKTRRAIFPFHFHLFPPLFTSWTPLHPSLLFCSYVAIGDFD